MDTIGERIKKLRKAANLTQEELGKAINKSKGNVSGYESGKFEPSANTIIDMSKCFNISTDYLLLGEENKILNFTEEELEIINLYRNCDSVGKTGVKGLLKTLSKPKEHEGKLSNSRIG